MNMQQMMAQAQKMQRELRKAQAELAKKEFIVSKNCFVPKPDVDSMIISLTKKENKPVLKDEKLFFDIVRESFQFKRKTLKNNLKKYDFNKVFEVLQKHNIDENVRAEELPLEIFIEISNNLYEA